MLQIFVRLCCESYLDPTTRPYPRMATCNFAISAGHSRGLPAGGGVS